MPIITPISIPIEWDPSPSSDVYYRVSYNELFSFDVENLEDIFGSDLEATLTELTPSSTYKIYVCALVTRLGITAKSDPAVIVENTRKFSFHLVQTYSFTNV